MSLLCLFCRNEYLKKIILSLSPPRWEEKSTTSMATEQRHFF